MSEAGAQVDTVDLLSENIRSCKGCFHCWSVDPGVCIQNDAMQEIVRRFLISDIVVFVSPLYAYTISSTLKIFMERTLQLTAPVITLSRSGTDRNSSRFKGQGPHIAAAIIVAGLRNPSLAAPAAETLRLYAESLEIEFAGTLVRNESFLLQFTDTKPVAINSIEHAFYTAGIELIQKSKFSETTLKNASLSLVPDFKTFSLYSDIYWEYGQNFAFHQGDNAKVKNATNRDIRLLMNEMTFGFDSIAAGNLEATISYEFFNPDFQFTHIIQGGNCTIEPALRQSSDCQISCQTEYWVQMLLGDSDPLELISRGLLTVQGNKSLFRKLNRIFKPHRS
jgi:hypothetical protein